MAEQKTLEATEIRSKQQEMVERINQLREELNTLRKENGKEEW